jgi:hypothetical protein
MKKYIFIHGACQGGWVWNKIEGLLKSNNIDYETPDLPGHGYDKTPLNEITLSGNATFFSNYIELFDIIFKNDW